MTRTSLLALPMALSFAFAAPAFADPSEPATQAAEAAPNVRYRTATIDGVNVFYREAGPADRRRSCCCTASRPRRTCSAISSRRSRIVIASSRPTIPASATATCPTARNSSTALRLRRHVTDKLLTRLGVQHYALYVMDYGAPVGYRLAIKHPERVTALMIQNGNAYEEGLEEFWKPIKAYWASVNRRRTQRCCARARRSQATRSQYTRRRSRIASRVDPERWVHDQALLDRPGNVEIQLDLFYDYRTNLALYPQFQQFFRERQPPALDRLGQERRDISRRGRRAVHCKDLPRRRAPPARHRALRARRSGRRNRGADARLPRPGAAAQ